MQASQKRRTATTMPNRLHYHSPIQEAESYYLVSDHGGGSFTAKRAPIERCFTLDSSTAAAFNGIGCYSNACVDSPLNFSLGSPISCVADEMIDLKHKLKEIESAMLGPDHLTIPASYEDDNGGGTNLCHENENWGRIADSISKRDVKQVLISCSKAVSDNDLLMVQWLIDELRRMVSVSGDPTQRLGAYMLEGLVAKLAWPGSNICKALKFKQPPSSELLSCTQTLYELCPYFKFAYMSANGAIADAMKDENRVHIVDFRIAQGSQWITLIQAFAARPGGPPRIRITAIDDSVSAYARGGGLHIVGRKLSKLAEAFNVPFEFHDAADVAVESLGVSAGEAVAVNFAFSMAENRRRDRILKLVKGLSPRVVTVVEREFGADSAAFFPSFVEAVDYYSAMFESMEAAMPRDRRERIGVERHCLGREVVNVVACEGAERHEMIGKWRSRMGMAGFRPYPLSSLVNATIKSLLESYSDKYKVEERDGALYLGWMGRYLVTSSAWK